MPLIASRAPRGSHRFATLFHLSIYSWVLELGIPDKLSQRADEVILWYGSASCSKMLMQQPGRSEGSASYLRELKSTFRLIVDKNEDKGQQVKVPTKPNQKPVSQKALVRRFSYNPKLLYTFVYLPRIVVGAQSLVPP